MITNIIVILALLFILALILAPIYYFTQRSKYVEEQDETQDETQDEAQDGG